MRIVVYHPWLYLKGGCERLWLEYLRRTRHQVTLAASYFSPHSTFHEFQHLPVHAVGGRVGQPNVRRSARGLLSTLASLASARLPVQGADRLVVSSEGLGDFVGLAGARLPPTVAYVHTPLKIVYDPVTAALLPDVLPARRLALYRTLAPVYRVANRVAWRRYVRVIANSQEVRQRILRHRLAPASRVEVLHPGASPMPAPVEAVAGSPYLLVAGRIMWQKRVELALEAQRVLVRKLPHARLVVAGAVDEKSRPYLARLEAQAADVPNVSFEPNPTDDRFAALMAGCRGVVYTAPNEDWGILPVEAMASGKPVIATRAGGPSESVLDGRTGWLCAHEPQAYAEAMERLWRLDDADYAQVVQACRERGREFGWDRFASRLDDLLERS